MARSEANDAPAPPAQAQQTRASRLMPSLLIGCILIEDGAMLFHTTAVSEHISFCLTPFRN